ncbi:hypothetical protein ACFL2T_00305 [Elusimicrobiota bacterium]
MPFSVLNKTDGLPATDKVFPTRADAERFIVEFRARFRDKGYYLTTQGSKIAPDEIELIVLDED